MNYLLDTNIVSAFIKDFREIENRIYQISGEGNEAFISIVTHYEIRRGLLAVNAVRKMKIFEQFCRRVRILFLDTIRISEKAAEIHTELKKQGCPIPDNDILIAATASCHKLILVTNDKHLNYIRELRIENWLGNGM
jgi:tRNA(fMet)-specific endonuclease VapC